MAVSATKYRVTARDATGFKDYRRAGIAWPRGAGNYLEVLVVDQAEDPPGREVDGQLALGRDTFARVQADPHLFSDVVVAGGIAGDSGEVVELRQALDDAKLTFDQLGAENAKLQGENSKLTARVEELEKGNASLKDRCVELEQLLAQATAPAAAEHATKDGDKPNAKGAKK